jgi:hypothetical protein
MSIRHWPVAERPREKLLSRGAESLSDAELLAIFLRTGIAGSNAIELGRELLEQHGGLRAWLDLPPARLKACRGLGVATTALLLAALELGRRYLLADLQRGDALANPDATRRFLQARLSGSPMRCSPACSSTTATGSSPTRPCSAAPSTAPASTRARWSRLRCAQRGGPDSGPQPPLRGRRAQPGGPCTSPDACGRPSAGGHPGAGPFGDRRREAVSFAERGLL